MTEYTSFGRRKPRPPTWSERQRLEWSKEEGTIDVFVEPENAPSGFWKNIVQAISHYLPSNESTVWNDWGHEFRWSEGMEALPHPHYQLRRIIEEGYLETTYGTYEVSVGLKLSAIEHVLDVVPEGDAALLRDLINDRARYHRVGVQIEGNRFLPVTSEHVHKEVVQPTLALLREGRFEGIDALYRKAFDRALSGDPAGAVTVATSAVEEMLRLGLGTTKGELGSLTVEARDAGWISPAVQQIVVKLSAMRDDSDAHTAGTNDFETGMLALHLAAAILLYLGHRRPFA